MLWRIDAAGMVQVFRWIVASLDRVEGEIGDLILGHEVWCWIAMAIKTPTHAQWLGLTHHLHLVDATMARSAIYAFANVNRMVELGMLRKHMNLDPFDWFSGLIGVAHQLQAWALGLNHAVAAHTSFSGRNGSKRGAFDCTVAITTVHSHLARMQLVTERHGLLWRVTDIGPLGRKKVPNKKNYTDKRNGGTDRNKSRNAIGPLRKNGCHSITFMQEGLTRKIRLRWVIHSLHDDRISSSSRLREQVSHQKIQLRNFPRLIDLNQEN
jgi:hypothetical protein